MAGIKKGFGANIKIAVDKSRESKESFRSDIQSLAGTQNVQVRPRISKDDLRLLTHQIQGQLDASKFKIKIHEINISEAKKQLEKELKESIGKFSSSGKVDPISANTKYGQVARNSALPMLKKQAAELESYFGKQEEVIKRLIKYSQTHFDKIDMLKETQDMFGENGMGSSTLAKQLDGYRKYINYMKKLVEINGGVINGKTLDDFNTKFATSADDIVKSTMQIQTGINSIDTTGVISQLDAVTQKLDHIVSVFGNTQSGDNTFGRTVKSTVKASTEATKARKREYKSISDLVAIEKERRRGLELINKITQQNTKKSASTYIDRISPFESIFNNKNLTLKGAREAIAQIQAINSEMKIAGASGKSLGDTIAHAYKKFGGWALVTKSLSTVIRASKQIYRNVVELDTAMTELKKVTDETSTTYERFFDGAITRARRLGATLSDVILATADYARLGYNIQDASVLADVSIIYKNVADGLTDINEASESIISTMQAFGIEASRAMEIVDRFNEVGRHNCPAA